MRKAFLILVLGCLLIVPVCLNIKAYGQGTSLTQDEARIPIGTLTDYPAGTIKPFPKFKLIVFSDAQGLYALSTQCTHMGCTVSFRHMRKIFTCSCHGSKFNQEGAVLRGPATTNLSWFFIGIDEQGRLYVDKTRVVPAGTKYKFTP